MAVYETGFKQTMTYESESWVLTVSLRRKLQVIDIKYLTSVLGVAKSDRIMNDAIRRGVSSGLSYNKNRKTTTQMFWPFKQNVCHQTSETDMRSMTESRKSKTKTKENVEW